MKALRVVAPFVMAAAIIGIASAQTVSSSPKKPPVKSAVASSWTQVPVPPLKAFHPPQPRRVELSNGMVIFFQEDHELPFINGVIRIRGGSRDEPGEKAGLAALYAESWRNGGTKTKTGDQLDDFLESRAARVETISSADSEFIQWSSLKTDFDLVFPVVLDLLQAPEFRRDKMDLALQQLSSAVARRNDDVGEIANRESSKLAYGSANPYARTPELYTLSAITRDDLIAWHHRTQAPNNMILGLVGDFDSKVMESKLRNAFAKLSKGEPFASAAIDYQSAVPGIYFIEKDDVNQSEIRMAHLGIDRHNPDYYAVEVLNELFGGSFSSRLFSTVRTKEGLAYSVGGGIGSAFDHPGIFRVSTGTKSSTTAAAIDSLNRQITKLLIGGVAHSELKKAKDDILNSFVFAFDSKEKVLTEQIRYEFYGYRPDFLELYRAGIEKVTAADVERAARKYIHPDKIVVLVVGNAKDFDRSLATFGKVTPIDTSILEAPPAKPQ